MQSFYVRKMVWFCFLEDHYIKSISSEKEQGNQL